MTEDRTNTIETQKLVGWVLCAPKWGGAILYEGNPNHQLDNMRLDEFQFCRKQFPIIVPTKREAVVWQKKWNSLRHRDVTVAGMRIKAVGKDALVRPVKVKISLEML